MRFSSFSKKKKFVIGVLVLGAGMYALDTLSWWSGVPSRPQLGSYSIRKYYYINENFGKYSIESAGVYQEKCVNALFSHSGLKTCWWLARHPRNVIHVN